MAVERRPELLEPSNGHARPIDVVRPQEPPLGDLVKGLADDAGELVRQEIALAKTELRETVSRVSKDAVSVAVGGGIALLGALSLTAFVIVLLGDLVFGDNYWLSALIVGVVLLAIGGIVAIRAMKDLKSNGVTPDETIHTLEEDRRWAKQEARDFKRELTA